MREIHLKDVIAEGTNGDISLNALMGKRVKDIQGYVSSAFGTPYLKLSKLIFEDGTELFFEGEHDFPYLADYSDPSPLGEEVMQRLIDEATP